MKKFTSIIPYVIGLFVIETLLCIVFFEAEYFIRACIRHYDWGYRQALRDAIEMNILRFIFYFVMNLCAFYFLRKYVKRTLHLALINSGTYVVISGICGIIMPAVLSWFETYAIYATIATFISPFLLNKFTWFRKIML